MLEAARELFAIKGMEATLNDVAHHANVGRGHGLPPVRHEGGTGRRDLRRRRSSRSSALAETALQQEDSWDGFVWFVEHLCELTATDRGLREMVYSKAYGGYRVECARERLIPPLSKLVERARDDGHLRPDVEPTDMPIVGLLAGTVSEWAGHVEPQLWRRYVALLLDGMRRQRGPAASCGRRTRGRADGRGDAAAGSRRAERRPSSWSFIKLRLWRR